VGRGADGRALPLGWGSRARVSGGDQAAGSAHLNLEFADVLFLLLHRRLSVVQDLARVPRRVPEPLRDTAGAHASPHWGPLAPPTSGVRARGHAKPSARHWQRNTTQPGSIRGLDAHSYQCPSGTRDTAPTGTPARRESPPAFELQEPASGGEAVPAGGGLTRISSSHSIRILSLSAFSFRILSFLNAIVAALRSLRDSNSCMCPGGGRNRDGFRAKGR